MNQQVLWTQCPGISFYRPYKKNNLSRVRKTIILVTHELSFASQADYLVVFKNGRIESSGSFEQVMGQSPWFAAAYEKNRCNFFRQNNHKAETNIFLSCEDYIYVRLCGLYLCPKK